MTCSVVRQVITGLVLFFSIGACATAGESGFVDLIGSANLMDWVQRGGRAEYRLENGEIVGRTVLDSPNSFLCTKKSYADFVLEFDVKIDARLNSGVQIRGESRPDYRDGVVFGYQVEIDPSERAWSGGLYDEKRRGWLATLEGNEAARRAFVNGKWNHYRIEASGDRLRTWVNGVPAADLIDGMTRTGFIALQVHQADVAGMEVRWRKLRIKELPEAATGAAMNTLTQAERAQGFELLWDGRTSWGWKSARGAEFPARGWEMKDGVLSVLESGGAEARAYGDIVTLQSYGDFELCLEFRLTPGANSGIKYYVDIDLNRGPGSAIGLEYQLLDDALHPDAQMGRGGNRKLAALYDLIPAVESKPARPIGEWNKARVVSKGKHVEHWLNGVKVLEFERGSDDFRKLVAESKYKVWPGFGEKETGPILLQDHGNRVSFRNIKIRRLPGS
ncbi:MAG: DUF1080 domain-containing protein [Vicinamibacteria bacterium]|nr:DUF1080 domain-containing protein [Vicinamibacteria bacterium]